MSLKVTLPSVTTLEIRRLNGQVVQRQITKEFFREHINIRDRKIRPVMRTVKIDEYGWPIKELEKLVITETEEDGDIFDK